MKVLTGILILLLLLTVNPSSSRITNDQATPSINLVGSLDYTIINNTNNQPMSIMFSQKINVLTPGMFNIRGLHPSITMWNSTYYYPSATISLDKFITFTNSGTDTINTIWGFGNFYNHSSFDYSISNLNITYKLILSPVDDALNSIGTVIQSDYLTVTFLDYAQYDLQNVKTFDIFSGSYINLLNDTSSSYEVGDSFVYDVFKIDQTRPPLYNPFGLGLQVDTDSQYNLTIAGIDTNSNALLIDAFNSTQEWNGVYSGMPYSYLFISTNTTSDLLGSLAFSLFSKELGGVLQNHGYFSVTNSSNTTSFEMTLHSYFNVSGYDFYENYTVVYNTQLGIMMSYIVNARIVSNTEYLVSYGYKLSAINSKLSRDNNFTIPGQETSSSSSEPQPSTSGPPSSSSSKSSGNGFLKMGFLAPIAAIVFLKWKRNKL